MAQSCCQCAHESNLPLDFLYCCGVGCELCICKQCNVGGNQKIWHCSADCRDNSNAPQGPYQSKRKQQKKRTKSVAPPDGGAERDELQRKAAAYDQITATYKKVEELRPQLQQMRRKLEDARRQMHELQAAYKQQCDDLNSVRAQYTSTDEKLQAIIRQMYQVRNLQLDPSTCTTEAVARYMALVTQRTEIEETRRLFNTDLSEQARREYEMVKDKEVQERIVSDMLIDMVAMDAQLEQLKDKMKQLLSN